MKLIHRVNLYLFLIASLFIIFVQACSEKKYIIRKDNIEVSGLVLACYCDPCWSGWYPNPTYEKRYTVETGKQATVTFLSDYGRLYSTNTDDSSVYHFFIESGNYDIIVKTGHSFPDTFWNVSIANDTSLDLAIAYDWLIDDTVWISFRYPDALDTLGMDTEVEHIRKLNYLLGGDFKEVFDIREIKTYDFVNDTITYVVYSISLFFDGYVWDVAERAYRLIQTPELDFPEGMSVGISVYPCLD